MTIFLILLPIVLFVLNIWITARRLNWQDHDISILQGDVESIQRLIVKASDVPKVVIKPARSVSLSDPDMKIITKQKETQSFKKLNKTE